VAGLLLPDEDATEVPVQERQIGFVFQSYALFRHMTVAQNIAFGPRIRRLGIDIDERCAHFFPFLLLLFRWLLPSQTPMQGLQGQCHVGQPCGQA
jgi:ABC-type sulfate/molybdate transport systems ATPase subunit